VCGHFVDAMRIHGVPDEVLTDNGKVFTGRHSSTPSEVLFDRICRQNGITHRLTGIRSPTTTGKVCEHHSWRSRPGRSDPGKGVTTVSFVRFVGRSGGCASARTGRTTLT
jgi:hypothetical protein